LDQGGLQAYWIKELPLHAASRKTMGRRGAYVRDRMIRPNDEKTPFGVLGGPYASQHKRRSSRHEGEEKTWGLVFVTVSISR